MKLFRFSLRAIAVFSVLSLGFLGCSKEEETQSELTPEQAQKAIETTVEEFYGCLRNVNDGGFSDFFYNAFFVIAKDDRKEKVYTYTLPDGSVYTRTYTEGDSYSWSEILGDKFDEQYGPLNENQGFKFQQLKGNYSWNASTEKWEKSPNSSRIELRFPANKDAKSNNAYLILENYEDIEVAVSSSEKAKMPTKGKLLVTIDGKEMFKIEFANVTYEKTTSFPMPLTANISIYANPLTTNIQWKNKTPEVFTLDITMTSSGGCKTAINGEVTVKNSNYASLTSEKDLKKANFKLVHNNITVSLDADLEKLFALEKSPTAEQVNMYVKSEVFHKNSKIADLVANQDAEGKMIPELIFSDGSRKQAQDYLKDFDKRIEEIFKKFFNAEDRD
ncbi:hypothetical protein [Capnocytophaga canimorsus]|uniref:hypothetical protein n=1 Tax=Capnocytophaga canimorsus TaxID=28188 RepID=UPI00385A738D